MRALSLQTRLLAGLAVLFLGAMAALGFVLLGEAHARQARFELEQARYQAKTLAEASVDALISEDFELMERWVHAAMPSANYAYATLVRPNGQVLTHIDHSYIGRSIATQHVPQPDEAQLTYHSRPVRELRHPVISGRTHLANAHVAYYLDTDAGLAPETRRKIALTLVLLLGALGLGAVFISRKIIAPVKALTVAVADTSFERPVTLGAALSARNDEVGQLAQSFDALLRRLAQSYEQLKYYNLELEQRVEERTRELVDAAHRVEESRSRIAAIMDNVAEGIVTIDETGHIESFNRAAEKLFGYTVREIMGKPVEMLMPEEFRRDHQSHLRRYLDTGQSRIVGREPRELTALRKDGTPFSIELAVSAVQVGLHKVFVGLIRDVTERKAMVDQLRHIAEHDALTGLYNRRYFYGELERVVARARRGNGQSSALMFIDLDKFKLVNDTLGHAAGDRVLIEVANVLRNRARKSDVLTRLGGDEFAVLLYDAAAESAPVIAESFRQQILNYRLQQGTVSMSVGCSIGVAIIDERAGTLDEVLAQADRACYEAKHAGRNCVRVFDPRDTTSIGNAV